MADLDKNLSWETSALNTYNLMEFLKRKLKEFVVVQVWISKRPRVSESTPLKPISLYNKVKMVAGNNVIFKDIEVFI